MAAETSDTVCLGVGLHSGYGAAQRMYVLRGYVPDAAPACGMRAACGTNMRRA